MHDKEQIFLSREGDLNTIEELCSSTWPTLYRYIYYKVQNREEAEDITQETYTKAITYIKGANVKIEKQINFLKRVSLNIIRDRWRKKKNQGVVVDFDSINPDECAIDDSTEGSAQREVIKDALGKLSDEQRTVVELRIIKGFSVAETARTINKKEATVRVIQYRALKALAEILENSVK